MPNQNYDSYSTHDKDQSTRNRHRDGGHSSKKKEYRVRDHSHKQTSRPERGRPRRDTDVSRPKPRGHRGQRNNDDTRRKTNDAPRTKEQIEDDKTMQAYLAGREKDPRGGRVIVPVSEEQLLKNAERRKKTFVQRHQYTLNEEEAPNQLTGTLSEIGGSSEEMIVDVDVEEEQERERLRKRERERERKNATKTHRRTRAEIEGPLPEDKLSTPELEKLNFYLKLKIDQGRIVPEEDKKKPLRQLREQYNKHPLPPVSVSLEEKLKAAINRSQVHDLLLRRKVDDEQKLVDKMEREEGDKDAIRAKKKEMYEMIQTYTITRQAMTEDKRKLRSGINAQKLAKRQAMREKEFQALAPEVRARILSQRKQDEEKDHKFRDKQREQEYSRGYENRTNLLQSKLPLFLGIVSDVKEDPKRVFSTSNNPLRKRLTHAIGEVLHPLINYDVKIHGGQHAVVINKGLAALHQILSMMYTAYKDSVRRIRNENINLHLIGQKNMPVNHRELTDNWFDLKTSMNNIGMVFPKDNIVRKYTQSELELEKEQKDKNRPGRRRPHTAGEGDSKHRPREDRHRSEKQQRNGDRTRRIEQTQNRQESGTKRRGDSRRRDTEPQRKEESRRAYAPRTQTKRLSRGADDQWVRGRQTDRHTASTDGQTKRLGRGADNQWVRDRQADRRTDRTRGQKDGRSRGKDGRSRGADGQRGKDGRSRGEDGRSRGTDGRSRGTGGRKTDAAEGRMKKREKDKQTESEATDTETDEGMTREYFDAKQKELQDSRLRVQKKKRKGLHG